MPENHFLPVLLPVQCTLMMSLLVCKIRTVCVDLFYASILGLQNKVLKLLDWKTITNAFVCIMCVHIDIYVYTTKSILIDIDKRIYQYSGLV